MRICIPDLEYAISLYLKGKKDKSMLFFFILKIRGYPYTGICMTLTCFNNCWSKAILPKLLNRHTNKD
jgi:hypothetical protein